MSTTNDPDKNKTPETTADVATETVYVNKYTTSRGQDKVYHTDTDCPHLKPVGDGSREADADAIPWPECRWCADELHRTNDGSEHELYQRLVNPDTDATLIDAVKSDTAGRRRHMGCPDCGGTVERKDNGARFHCADCGGDYRADEVVV